MCIVLVQAARFHKINLTHLIQLETEEDDSWNWILSIDYKIQIYRSYSLIQFDMFHLKIKQIVPMNNYIIENCYEHASLGKKVQDHWACNIDVFVL